MLQLQVLFFGQCGFGQCIQYQQVMVIVLGYLGCVIVGVFLVKGVQLVVQVEVFGVGVVGVYVGIGFILDLD